MCLQVIDSDFVGLSLQDQQQAINTMLASLEQENVALDIGNYRNAPPGFRIWGGATVETSDLQALTPWLDWVFAEFKLSTQEQQHD
jgi:phosphoserine aminotransferase